MGRTSKNTKLGIPEKPRKIKKFRSRRYRAAPGFQAIPVMTASISLPMNLKRFPLLLTAKGKGRKKKKTAENNGKPSVANAF